MKNGSYAVAEDGERNLVDNDHSHESAFSKAQPAPLPKMGNAPHLSVAARLVAAREARGLTAQDVAIRTRVTLRHIDALETGDYGAMPGRPYALGFARAYARAVGLNDAEIAAVVRVELEGSAPRQEARALNQFEVGDPAKTPSRLVGWLALLLVGGILAMGGVFWRSYYAPAVSLPQLTQENDRPAVPSAQAQVGTSQSPRPQMAANGAVVFTALEEGIWVKFYDGQGKQLMQKQLKKGESYEVPRDVTEPRLWTGRPDALAITIGGQAMPRLADTQGVVKDVPVDAASLRTRTGPSPGQTAVPQLPAAQ